MVVGDARKRNLSGEDRFIRWFHLTVATRPGRLKLALLPVQVLQRLRLYTPLRRLRVFELLPPRLQELERLLPELAPMRSKPLPSHTGAGGMDAMLVALQNTVAHRKGAAAAASKKPVRATVGLYTGCVGAVLHDGVNRRAIELLSACGVDVLVPRMQLCCGAIHQRHAFDDIAAAMARRNVDSFMPREGKVADFIATTDAGCVATLRNYATLLRDDPEYAGRAREFSKRVRDISELLLELPLPIIKHRVDASAACHDPCPRASDKTSHQIVAVASTALLTRVPGLVFANDASGNTACPSIHKDATYCVTSHLRCALRIRSHARILGKPLDVVHPLDLVHRAVFGKRR